MGLQSQELAEAADRTASSLDGRGELWVSENRAARRTAAIAIYISAAFALYMAANMARNFVLPLRATELGATKGEVGLLLGLLVFTAGFVAVTGGAIGDHVGRRLTILAAIAISLVAQVGLALSPNLAPMYFFQVVAGIGLGTTQAALFAAAADGAAPGQLGRAMGALTVGIQLGLLSGPAVAGLALARFGLQEVIALSAVLYAVALVLMMVGPTVNSNRRGSHEMLRNTLATVRQWRFLTAIVAALAWSILWPTVQSFAPLIGKEFLHLPVQLVGFLVAGFGLVSALLAVPAGRIVDRTQDKQTLVAVLAIVVGCLVVGFGHTSGAITGVLVLTVTAIIATVTGISVAVSYLGLASAPARGVAMGLLLTTQNLGAGIGAAIFGVLLQGHGYRDGLTVFGASAVALFLLAALLRYVKHLTSTSGLVSATPR